MEVPGLLEVMMTKEALKTFLYLAACVLYCVWQSLNHDVVVQYEVDVPATASHPSPSSDTPQNTYFW
jgi:hypothetical protein